MKRKVLEDIELQRVAEYRNKGASWLGIEKILKEEGIDVSRHIIKRGYEDWVASQQKGLFDDIRQKVAEEEFRKHIKALTDFALELPFIMAFPGRADFYNDLDEYYKLVFSMSKNMGDIGLDDFFKEIKVDQLIHEGGNQQRTNRLLFGSLREHTQHDIDWKLWDTWWSDLNILKEKMTSLSRLSNQQVETCKGKYELTKSGMNELTIELIYQEIKKIVTNIAWVLIQQGVKQLPEDAFITYRRDNKLWFVKANLPHLQTDVWIREKTRDYCERIVSLIKEVLTSLLTSPIYITLVNAVQTMTDNTKEFLDSIDPLIIKPILIRTNCRLCPVLLPGR